MKDDIPGIEEPEGQMVMDAVVPPNDDILSTILRLCSKLQELQELAERQALELETTTKAIKDLSESRIPDLMNSVNLTELRLQSGKKIQIRPEYFASIPKDKEDEAYSWLESRNMAGIVKETLKVDASQKEILIENNVEFQSERKIHPSTLRSFVRERIESGEQFPRELFGVHEVDRAVVK